MKKLFLLLFISLSLSLRAQETRSDSTVSVAEAIENQPQDSRKTSEQKRPESKRMYYGGHLNLSFGKYTVIGVQPIIGYKITPRLSAGLKIRYDYIKDKRYTTPYTTSNYGGSIFARYRVIPAIYLHAEYAYNNYELFYSTEGSHREWVPYLLLGAGYSQRVGANSWLNFQILFDVLQDSDSPYNRWEPFYSVGVGIGF